jgi:hypothetical protein
MSLEPRVRRHAAPRPELVELAERVARLETTAGHLQETLTRIDVTLSKMQQKIDTLAAGMAQGIGGLRVGAVLGQAAAGVVGFVAAHLWPLSK